MGKDCCRGNEQLDAKALWLCEGEVGGSKTSPDLPVCVSLSKCAESCKRSLNKEILHVVIKHYITQGYVIHALRNIAS